MKKRNIPEREIENILEQKFSILNYNFKVGDKNRNVFMQNPRSKEECSLLEGKHPDYVVYLDEKRTTPNIIIEVKKPHMNLKDTYKQAIDYAKKLNSDIIILFDGLIVKSYFVNDENSLKIDDIEVTDILKKEEYNKFITENKSNIISSELEILSKKDLINVFNYANNKLRKSGIQKGIERFTEFSNLLFLKLISEENEIIFDNIPDHIKWNAYKNKKGDELLSYINNVVIPELERIFNKQEQESLFSKLLIRDTESLENIINKLDKLYLKGIQTDIKGDAFEYFIQKYNSSNNDLGEYFTPRHIVNFLVTLADISYGEKVYDPFCGTGGMLISAFTFLVNKLKNNSNFKITDSIMKEIKENMFYGSEISSTAKIAKMNMILTGDGHSNIVQQDTLKNPVEKKYDVILTNIPFNLEVDPTDYYYTLGTTTGNNQCIEHIVKSLSKSPNARAFVIVPEGFLNNTDSLNTRKLLIDNSLLKGIISLPVGVFLPYADAKTSILVLQGFNGVPVDKVFFYRVKNDGFTLTTRRRKKEGLNDLDEFLSNSTDNFDTINYDKIKKNKNYSLLYFKYNKKIPENYEILENIVKSVDIRNKEGKSTVTITKKNFYGVELGKDYWGDNFASVTSETNENYKILEKNMLAYNPSRINIGSIGINISDEKYAVTAAYHVFEVFNGEFLPEYIYLYLKSQEGRDEIVTRCFGSVRQSLNAEDFLQIGIPKISLEKQEIFCKEAKKMYNEYKLLEKRINTFDISLL